VLDWWKRERGKRSTWFWLVVVAVECIALVVVFRDVLGGSATIAAWVSGLGAFAAAAVAVWAALRAERIALRVDDRRREDERLEREQRGAVLAYALLSPLIVVSAEAGMILDRYAEYYKSADTDGFMSVHTVRLQVTIPSILSSATPDTHLLSVSMAKQVAFLTGQFFAYEDLVKKGVKANGEARKLDIATLQKLEKQLVSIRRLTSSVIAAIRREYPYPL
jgi:hypothetical protein